ncbi:response regulator transcription factor [Xanthomonas sp. WHRI 10064A]|uniref:response regulator transcription factor n=1 Tax=unclassified Xanthomonas TaxID=2643310 RepID=UPI002B23A910|nr:MULTISPECIES: response regulator transcription factor [unclassified Xanthomonas]MEA9585921.1 response regulator transcription factor [Xanthomonas sp. WHRI 10064B]MEA9614348.1 response regulator transcription factor [Xanthomonas sp. WHRI 10064A]
MAIAVYVIGRHRLVRESIEMILSREPGITVRSGTGTGKEALQQIPVTCPDVVLCDLTLPDARAIDVIPHLIGNDGMPRVVVLSEMDDGPWPVRVMRAGASGCISLSSEVPELMKAVRSAAAGHFYLGSAIAQNLAFNPQPASGDPFDTLSPRELAVASLLAQGIRQKEVARRLGVNSKTVGTYKARLQKKLGVSHTVALLQLAIRYDRLRELDMSWLPPR